MALLSELKYQQGMKVSEISAFKGLNRRGTIKSGELSACNNLGFQNYPALSKAKIENSSIISVSDYTALFEWDEHIVSVAGRTLFYDGNAMATVTAGEKQFAVVNTKLIIWPDKIYIDIHTNTVGTFARKFVSIGTGFVGGSGNTSTLFFSNEKTGKSQGGNYSKAHNYQIAVYGNINDINFYDDAITWDSENGWTLPVPVIKSGMDLIDGDIVIPKATHAILAGGGVDPEYSYSLPDTRAEENNIGAIDVVSNISFEAVDTNEYLLHTTETIYQSKIHRGVNMSLKVGDYVQISGARSNSKESATVTETGDGYIKFDTTFTANATLPIGVVIAVKMPNLDYICSCNNRLYGVSNTAVSSIYNSNTKKFDTFHSRCLYVSALGEPDKFYNFSGVDTDSYQVAVASEGDFTAAVAMDGSVIFMKEKLVYRLYGEYPSNFYLSEYAIPGCAAGCHKTCKVINDVLYYLSRHGVYAYNGNAPTYISWGLGEIAAVKASAGAKETRYYLSINTADGDQTCVYDTDLSFWLQYDAAYHYDFATVGTNLYCTHGKNLSILEGCGIVNIGSWYAVFKDEDEGTIERKYYQYIRLRLHLPEGSYLKVTWYFDDGPALHSQIIRSQGKYADRTVVIPLNNNRADRITIRLDGSGDIQVKTLQRIYTLGTGEAR